MTKYIKEYIKKMENKLKKDITLKDIEELKDKISFFQHERLVHLFIMLFCLLMLIVFIALCFNNNLFVIPMLILLVLNVFYIIHYYFLENSVQYLYKVYDKMNDKIK